MNIPRHGAAKRKHHSSTYKSWAQMRKRCLCKTAMQYARYGGRGISICERWGDFANFLADMGERPAGATLDRIDNEGDYCPANCRWAPQFVQVRNRANTVFVTAYGLRLPLAEWAAKTGLSYNTLLQRVRRGLSAEDVVSRAYNVKPTGDARKARADAQFVLIDGKAMRVHDWAQSLGVSYLCAYKRAKRAGLLTGRHSCAASALAASACSPATA